MIKIKGIRHHDLNRYRVNLQGVVYQTNSNVCVPVYLPDDGIWYVAIDTVTDRDNNSLTVIWGYRKQPRYNQCDKGITWVSGNRDINEENVRLATLINATYDDINEFTRYYVFNDNVSNNQITLNDVGWL